MFRTYSLSKISIEFPKYLAEYLGMREVPLSIISVCRKQFVRRRNLVFCRRVNVDGIDSRRKILAILSDTIVIQNRGDT